MYVRVIADRTQKLKLLKIQFSARFFRMWSCIIGQNFVFKLVYNRNHTKTKKKVARHSDFSIFFLPTELRQVFHGNKMLRHTFSGKQIGEGKTHIGGHKCECLCLVLIKKPNVSGPPKKSFRNKTKKNGRLKN